MVIVSREGSRLGRLSVQQRQAFGFQVDPEGRIIGDIDLPGGDGLWRKR
jgi:hypothetical protein